MTKQRMIPLRVSKLLLWIAALLCSTATQAAQYTKAQADSAYRTENYTLAAEMYEDIIKESGDDADVLYNIGNAYFRLKELPLAILNYERAARYRPHDTAIEHNITVANARLSGYIKPQNRMFFVTWYHNIMGSMRSGEWLIAGVVVFALSLASLLLYMLSAHIAVRKSAFACFVAFMTMTVCANTFAYTRHKVFVERRGAIVMTQSIIRATPADTSNEIVSVHPGVKVTIQGDTPSKSQWYEVELPDGKKGWIKRENVSRI